MNAEQRRKVRRERTERGACPECGVECAPFYRCEAHRAARRLYRKTHRPEAPPPVRNVEHTLLWAYRGRFVQSRVVAICQLCGAPAIVPLPDFLLAEQDDGTTHVCHPSLGGCNHGFADDSMRKAVRS